MLYNHEKSLKATEERIRDSNISISNKQLIFEFESCCFAEGLSIARILKHLTELKLLADMAGNDFKNIDRQSMMNLVGHIERMKRAERTKQDYKKLIRKFFKWIKKLFAEYEKALNALNVEKQVPFFAQHFISAGPKGSIALGRDEFAKMASKAAEFYRSVVQTSAKILSREAFKGIDILLLPTLQPPFQRSKMQKSTRKHSRLKILPSPITMAYQL